MYDLLITNTKIIDGTGSPEFIGQVAVENGKLKVLSADEKVEAKETIDAKGHYTVPGFIDPHSHGDIPLGQPFASLSKISQGITTHVTGMCGFSMFPVNPKTSPMLRESLGLLSLTFPDEMDTFTTCANFMKYSDTVKRPENTQFLIGLVTLRVAVMGYDNRPPTAEELEKMKFLMREAMENGAAGFSTGLVYVPCAYASEDEIVELCKIVAEYDGIYTTHIRNEGSGSFESIQEAINVARRSGVRTVISHHKMQGQANWGKTKETLAMIHAAIDEGLNITCDQYPYTACMTHLSVCVPPNYYTNGLSGVCELLQDPVMREQIKKEMNDPATPYDNYYLNAGGWKGVFVS
ncbi:MAG: amidohydrolase family protein, partial [Phascolarctobacterium sp.]|nr:amidohydrolase family protein [Phascolarctobacterium sp.]